VAASAGGCPRDRREHGLPGAGLLITGTIGVPSFRSQADAGRPRGGAERFALVRVLNQAAQRHDQHQADAAAQEQQRASDQLAPSQPAVVEGLDKLGTGGDRSKFEPPCLACTAVSWGRSFLVKSTRPIPSRPRGQTHEQPEQRGEQGAPALLGDHTSASRGRNQPDRRRRPRTGRRTRRRGRRQCRPGGWPASPAASRARGPGRRAGSRRRRTGRRAGRGLAAHGRELLGV
jgi:hypothetical protein